MKKITTILLLFVLAVVFSNSFAATDYTQYANCSFGYLFTSDHSPGTTITDSSPNGLNGVAEGAEAPDWLNTSPAKAYSGGYVDFTDDYITVSSGLLYNTYQTLVWWGEPIPTDNDRAFQYNCSSNSTYRWQVYRHDTSDALAYQFNNSTTDNIRGTTALSGLSGWQHFGITVDLTQTDNNRAIIYINGVAQSESSIAGTYSNGQGNSDTLYIGQRGDGAASLDNVDMDEIAYFSGFLSSTEINDIMDNGLKQIVVAGVTIGFAGHGYVIDTSSGTMGFGYAN